MAFTAPDDYLEFYDEVVRKSYALIELNYISGITKKNLNLWLDNFKTKEEKLMLALHFPNERFNEHPAFYELIEENNVLKIKE